MSRLIASPSLADACVSCHPGDMPATTPHRVDLDGAALVASYACATCGTAWRTWWELATVWPLRRENCKAIPQLLDELIAALASLFDGEINEGKTEEDT